jgi:hypothetical protein
LIWPSDGKDLARSFPLSAAWLGIVELDITLHVYWLIKIFVHPLYVVKLPRALMAQLERRFVVVKSE